MRVWVTRAEPGAARTAAALTALGHQPLVAPVLEVRDLIPAVPGTWAALAFTSANAVAAFGRLESPRTVPCFAVGDATADAARAAGYLDVRSAAGDGRDLAALIVAARPAGPILWPCAAETAFDLAAAAGEAASVLPLAVYETVPTACAPPPGFDAVLVHSPRAARVIAGKLTPDAPAGRLVCAISPAAARPLERLGFAEVRIADRPDEPALLARLGKALRPV
jgi:uroporphyrinogen-III synthase